MTKPNRVRGANRSRQAHGIVRRVERLEPRQLFAVSPVPAMNREDVDDVSSGGCPVCGAGGCCSHTDANGLVHMSCSFPEAAAATVGGLATQAVAVAPLADTFLLHSRPNATKKIYLDFDGHVTSGTAWNGGNSITTPAFSLDADFGVFSDAEKQAIQAVWTRVAEDFIPFEVDVTTEAPSVDDLRNTGGSDTRWGIRVVIGGDGAWYGSAAGVAYIGSFKWDSDTPCFVFAGQGWKANIEFIASCTSHEVGHTLGLGHDGYNGSEYYSGRGAGATSWGPLMGNPSRPLTQWSNGDYGGSTNTQDDVTVMATGYGFGFRPDDHGDTTATATLVSGSRFTVAGLIGQRTDVDMFGFTAVAGLLSVQVKPLATGANLDIVAQLRDAQGKVIATSNPIEALDASFNLTVTAGKYFISVDGTGMGDPSTTGYSDYGSLGQYTVTVGEPTNPLPTLTVADVLVSEGNAGTTSASLTFTLSAAAATAVSVRYATANGTATTSGNDYTAAAGTVTFAAGETRKMVTLAVRGDTRVEADETFTVGLTGAVGAVLARPSATVTITNDDGGVPPGPLPTLSVADVTVAEGNSGTTQATLTFTLSAASGSTVTVRYTPANGTATTADGDYVAAAGTVSFAAGDTQKTVTITVKGDTKNESDETFTVGLSNAVGATLARPSATVTIINDDAAVVTPTVSLEGPGTVTEGHTGLKTIRYSARLSQAVNWVTQVRWGVTAGTATVGTDFFAPRTDSELVFAANQTVVWFNVDIVGDRGVESDETYQVVLSRPVGLTLGAASSRTTTIVNDDAARLGSGVPTSRLQAGIFAAYALEFQAGSTGRKGQKS